MIKNLFLVFGRVRWALGSLFFALISLGVTGFSAEAPTTIPAKLSSEKASISNTAGVLTLPQIQKVFKKFEKPTLLSGQFQQVKTLKELDVKIKTSGQFQIKKVNEQRASVIWKIEKPDPMQVCIDEENISIDNPRLNKKTKLKMSEISQQDSSGLTKMIQLIKLNPELLDKDFFITHQKATFIIKPKLAQSYQFSEARVELDAQKNIKNIMLTETNTDVMEIQFSGTKERTLNRTEVLEKDCT